MKNFSNFTKLNVTKSSNFKIFIFGAGTIGRLSDLALKTKGFDANCFIDSDIRKQGNKVQNKEIISRMLKSMSKNVITSLIRKMHQYQLIRWKKFLELNLFIFYLS